MVYWQKLYLPEIHDAESAVSYYWAVLKLMNTGICIKNYLKQNQNYLPLRNNCFKLYLNIFDCRSFAKCNFSFLSIDEFRHPCTGRCHLKSLDGVQNKMFSQRNLRAKEQKVRKKCCDHNLFNRYLATPKIVAQLVQTIISDHDNDPASDQRECK